MVTRRSSFDSAQPSSEEELRRALDECEQEVESLREKLSDLRAAGTSFLADAAHAIRSPLTVIHSYMEILHDDLHEGLSEAQQSVLEIAFENVIRMRRLVEDLVDLAAFETGSAPIDLSLHTVRESIENVNVDLLSAATEKKLGLTFDVADGLPAIMIDRARFEDVLKRLLDNAFRSTTSGGSVRITARRHANHVVVMVEDTGVGIPADRIEEAFQPFVQLHRRTGENRQNYGLGLALCRRQIKAFGGTVDIESDEDRGTKVILRIPCSTDGSV
jgi:NtrC-family two-component system sensor histidine kinase KinB